MPSPFSVLMSLYQNENPEYFAAALQSVKDQTLAADQIVVVFDGPISHALEKVLDDAAIETITKVRLAENRGLAEALNAGLEYCKNEIVVRVDTDDINLPERFRLQVEFMERNPDVAAISANIDEFSDDPNTIISTRRVPTAHDAIVKMLGSRSPLNHPASVFRKSAVEAVDGYPKQRIAQDYGLWIKLCAAGYRFANINQALVLFRKSEAFFKRRGAREYIYYDFKLQYQLYSNNLISLPRFVYNFAGRSVVRLAPPMVLKLIYGFLRR